jgi:Ca2+-binding EF-hand superfamily protein
MQSGNFMAVRSGLKQGKCNAGPSGSNGRNKENAIRRSHTKWVPDLVQKYDTTGSGDLDREEVCSLLENLSGGLPISKDELDFVFKIADGRDRRVIGPEGMSMMLNAWDNYQSSREEIEAHFLKHDPEGTGRLDRDQIRNLLVDISGGKQVYGEDVEWVMNQADVLRNGVITKPELRRVLALWESRQHVQQACCILQ